MASKITIKKALIERGFASNPEQAEKLVLARRVTLSGQLVLSAGDKISEDQELKLLDEKKYLSRAGEKLDHALKKFNIDVKNLKCADVGASTGGFTGVLLAAGAEKVYAIDVARGEIAWKLRSDPRVILMEKTNARDLTSLAEKVDFVSIDVSFISVAKILPNVSKWLVENGKVVVLVKPQFEAARELVESGGIIKDKNTHLLVLRKFIEDAKASGFCVNALCSSPIKGMEGNKEFLALLQQDGVGMEDKVVLEVVEGN